MNATTSGAEQQQGGIMRPDTQQRQHAWLGVLTTCCLGPTCLEFMVASLSHQRSLGVRRGRLRSYFGALPFSGSQSSPCAVRKLAAGLQGPFQLGPPVALCKQLPGIPREVRRTGSESQWPELGTHAEGCSRETGLRTLLRSSPCSLGIFWGVWIRLLQLSGALRGPWNCSVQQTLIQSQLPSRPSRIQTLSPSSGASIPKWSGMGRKNKRMHSFFLFS